jgi:soluble lytic murein transglycosylase
MSSMVRNALIAALTVSAAAYAAPALAQDDAGRASLVAGQQSAMTYAVSRWEQLQASSGYSFEDYASFLLAYPGFPDEDKLKGYAEARLATEYVDPNRVLTYFAAEPPVTNAGRAAQALALMAVRPNEAETAARAAWRGGEMSPTAVATIQATFGSRFTARTTTRAWTLCCGSATRSAPRSSCRGSRRRARACSRRGSRSCRAATARPATRPR